MASLIETDWLLAYSPNGKKVDPAKMPPQIYQMMRVFFYCGWTSGAGRVMAAGRSIDETTQMMRVMEIMDCIQNDEAFLGCKKEDLKGPDNPNDVLPSIN
jgi:hypothetical protein